METKPGVYTTEFWTMVLGNVFSLVNITGLWNYVPNRLSELFMAVISAIYVLSRGQAKQGVGADPAVPGNYKLVPKMRDTTRRG